MKIAVLVNESRPRWEEVFGVLESTAEKYGVELIRCAATQEDSAAENKAIQSVVKEVDVLAAMGGDGTMLRAARVLGATRKPLLGINIGSLGFLTTVSEKEIDRALAALADNTYEVSERAVLECRLGSDNEEIGTFRALNDVVLHNGALARVVELDLYIDDVLVSTYTCDGMIVCTPTGSTGHSLSAGGPIMHPESPAILITTICPHTLSSRPLVIPDHSHIRIRMHEPTDELYLTIDGQRVRQMENDYFIDVTRAEHGVKLVQMPGYDYFSVLRKKLHWRGKATPS
jgi:NAD+ kinase